MLYLRKYKNPKPASQLSYINYSLQLQVIGCDKIHQISLKALTEHIWLYFSNSETKSQTSYDTVLHSNSVFLIFKFGYQIQQMLTDFQRWGEHVVQTDHGNTTGGQAVAFDPQESIGTQVPFPCQGCTV